jgi:hypothetical protein
MMHPWFCRVMVLMCTAFTSVTAAYEVRTQHITSFEHSQNLSTLHTLPNQPWRALERIELPSPCATPPLLLPDGTIAVGLQAPSAIAFVSRDHTVVATVRIPSRITHPLAHDARGRVMVVAESRVLTVTPDGGIRSDMGLPSRAIGPATILYDGSATILSANGSRQVEQVHLTPQGNIQSATSVTAGIVTGPIALDDDCIGFFTPRTFVRLQPNGTFEEYPAPENIRFAVFHRDTLAMISTNEIFLGSREASARVAVRLTATPHWISPVGDRRYALTVTTLNATHELWITNDRAEVVSRLVVPNGCTRPLVSQDGRLLVSCQGGDVLAVNQDGTEAWRISLRESIHTPIVALPHGMVIATQSNSLLFVE